jgi:hypothetical protein
MRRIIILFLLIYLFTYLFSVADAAKYRPELSGNFETGDRTYSELLEEAEEVLDFYTYDRYWLKYKQKLSSSDYYFLKMQYYRKDYDEQLNYNNITLDIWANYTYKINSKLRNRWELSYKDKDYFINSLKSYYGLKIKYQFDYNYNEKHDYTIYLQRQWNDYINNNSNDNSNDNTSDKLSINWNYKVNSDLDLTSTMQMDRQLYSNISDCSNKMGHKLSVGFKYKL